ncbi:APC family permease [Hominibacterium faecale]|uniref:APC family permease n=1 Tax=Hominibacterium faecale TaxID=2839743 RepID=UPI0022B2A90D|nr:APC family permease [Hominibacterium faecale]
MSKPTKEQAVNIYDNSKIVPQNVRLYTMVFLIFSFCCGGCFGIEDIICVSGPGLGLLLILILPIFWAAPQALTAAELGSALPYTGGFYKWIQRGLGEFWGFCAGWCRTLAQYFEMGGYVVLGVSYLSLAVEMTEAQAYMVKAAVIIIITIINLRGIKDVGAVTTGIAILVLVAFAAVTVLGFMNWNQSPFEPFYNVDEGFVWSLSGSLAVAMWIYSGFTSVSTVAGDCKDKSVVWKGLLIGIPLIAAVYFLPTIATLGSVGQWADWGPDGVNYMTVAAQFAGPAFGIGFAIIAFLANVSTYNTAMTTLSRGFYAIAEDCLAPKVLTKVSKKKGIPVFATLTISIFTLISVQYSFTMLITITVTLVIVDYVLIWIAGIRLRIKEPDLPRPFKVPGNTTAFVCLVTPGILIAAFSLLINGADYFLGGMVGLALVPVLYIIIKRVCGGLHKLDPVRHPINPKTKLCYGDLFRIALIFIVFVVLGIIAYFFMPIYEGSWGPEYYAETYGFANAYQVITQGILWISIAYAVIAVILIILDRKLDPKDQRPKVESFVLEKQPQE